MTAPRDAERVARVRLALRDAGLDAVVCRWPMNVLLLSGYWPVVGTAIAVATREGHIAVMAPEGERDLAERGWADDLRTFSPGSLDALPTYAEAVATPLAGLLHDLGLDRAGPDALHVGCETGPASEPASYAAMYLPGLSGTALLKASLPADATLFPADALLARLRSVKTPREIDRIRTACLIAGEAYAAGAAGLRPGQRETKIAAAFRDPLSTVGVGFVSPSGRPVARADGLVSCMSGPNGARAYVAYARSTDRVLEEGDLALVHCNSYADGYWTDVTRTYAAGRAPRDGDAALFDAVWEARAAALAAIRPGARAADVDQAARQALASRGFGDLFKHPTGHAVGFTAIDHDAPPRLHPRSPDVLEEGMVFNVEPAVYREGHGGIRHCDMGAVTATGVDLLTPFQPVLDGGG